MTIIVYHYSYSASSYLITIIENWLDVCLLYKNNVVADWLFHTTKQNEI